MRRADRLFRIVHYLRGRRLTRARELAHWLEVSERTVYRDIRDLTLSGVPIEGEAGVGYILRHGFDLPPLMFEYDEVEALVIGARMVEAWGSTPLAQAARSALAKIAGVLPADRRSAVEQTRVYAPAFHIDPQLGATFELLRRAVRDNRYTGFAYVREDGAASERTVRPLSLYFWGERWTLAAWCEMRQDFRNFRLDRISEVQVQQRTFAAEPGKTLADFLRAMQRKG